MIMINKKLTALHVFIFGNLIGITVFLLIYGVSVLSFTNVDWLLASTKLEGLSDLSQHYLGWVAFRNSPWHFPFGLFDGLYSDSLSITYTDSIPLFAIPFKLLSPLLPEQFQYFGLYGILSYALTGGFAALLLWFGTSSTIYSIIGSFFCAFTSSYEADVLSHGTRLAIFDSDGVLPLHGNFEIKTEYLDSVVGCALWRCYAD